MLGLGLNKKKYAQLRYVNELVYNPNTWVEWTKTNVTGDSTGLTIDASIASTYAMLPNCNFKPSTKYGVLLNIATNTLVTATNGLYGNVAGTIITYLVSNNGETGNKKHIITTPASITNNRMYIDKNVIGYSGIAKINNIRIFELPAGSQIETDFTNLTADRLYAKYKVKP